VGCLYLLSHEFFARFFVPPGLCGLDKRVAPLRLRVQKARKQRMLPLWLLSVRVTPVFPQWLVNICAPHLGVPFWYVIATTPLGLLPYNAVGVRAGASLGSLHSLDEVFTRRMALGLLGVGAMLLLPSLLARRYEDKMLLGAAGHTRGDSDASQTRNSAVTTPAPTFAGALAGALSGAVARTLSPAAPSAGSAGRGDMRAAEEGRTGASAAGGGAAPSGGGADRPDRGQKRRD
jgi:hypothetical protein